MMSNGTKVCMLSCTHGVEDDRIYWKECLSLANEGYTVSHIAAGKSDTKYISEHGIHCKEIRREGKSPMAAFKFYKKILAAAASEKAAVYHIHDWQLNIIGKKLKTLPWKPKIVYDAHESTGLLLQQDIGDTNPAYFKKFIKKQKAIRAANWEKRIAATYDAIITAEEYVLSSLKKIPNQLQAVIHNYSFFYNETPLNFAAKKYDVVYAGLLAKNRGISQLVDAAQLLKIENTAISILLIGSFCDENYKKEITTKIQTAGLENNIIIHPVVPYQEVKAYLSASKIGICAWLLTSKNKYAIPIKIFEYMAMGLPVIFSAGCVAANYITECNSGILVNPEEPGEIAAAIKNILNNQDLYQSYSRNGHLAVNKKYNWNNESKKLIELYTQLLK
jgi:glycosyltransferase involved in cell wall biosynthesis